MTEKKVYITREDTGETVVLGKDGVPGLVALAKVLAKVGIFYDPQERRYFSIASKRYVSDRLERE